MTNRKLIFKGIFGSHLYGTNTENSDHDYKEIFIPTGREIILGKGKEIYSNARPKSQEGEKNLAGEEETESFALRKWLHLLAEGQTVALDMLFTPLDKIILPSNIKDGKTYLYDPFESVWITIWNNKDKLLTKKSQVFLGYCQRQAKKYGIKGSRVADLRKSLDFLKTLHSSLKMYFYRDEIFNFVVDSTTTGSEFIRFETISNNVGIPIQYLNVCDRKIQMTSKVSEGIAILQKLFDEYGQRALQAEKNEGIDWKALSHAVRVCTQALELFETGFITFPRPDAKHLLEIKKGLLPYAPVADEIEELMDKVNKASLISLLKNEPDYDWIDNFVYDVYKQEIVK